MVCEWYFISSSIIRNCILFVNPIAIIGTAVFTYSHLNKKSYTNWLIALLPILIFVFTDNVSRLVLVGIYTLLLFFSIKEKLSNKGILVLYSLFLLVGIGILLNALVVAFGNVGYQLHNKEYMANIIKEGLRSAKLFGKAAVIADGERKTYIIYHIMMNFGYFVAAVMLILTGILEAITLKTAYSAQDNIHKFIACSAFALLLVKMVVSLLTNFGIVLNGFFTFFPIISFDCFETIAVFIILGLSGKKQ